MWEQEWPCGSYKGIQVELHFKGNHSFCCCTFCGKQSQNFLTLNLMPLILSALDSLLLAIKTWIWGKLGQFCFSAKKMMIPREQSMRWGYGENLLLMGKISFSFSIGFEECWALPALFRWTFLILLSITVPSGSTEYAVKTHNSCLSPLLYVGIWLSFIDVFRKSSASLMLKLWIDTFSLLLCIFSSLLFPASTCKPG